MGYQCISYWYAGGWNQHGWPLNHFSARERRFCSNVPVEAWNFCKGSYIEQKNHRNLVKTNCKRNSPNSGMYVESYSWWRWRLSLDIIAIIILSATYIHTFASNSSKTNWRFCMWTDCIAELFINNRNWAMAMDGSPSLGFTSGTSQSAGIHW